MGGKVTITFVRGGDKSVFDRDDLPAPSEQTHLTEPDGTPTVRARRNGKAAKVKPVVRPMKTEPKDLEDDAATPGTEPAPALDSQSANRPRPPFDPMNHGYAYVRMLNRNSVVVPVIASDIPARIHCGYQFIYGEPAVPREGGDADICDKAGPGWSAFPRSGGGGIKKMTEAVRYWHKCMLDDFAIKDEISPEVDWAWLDVVPRMIEKTASMEP